MNRIKKGSRLRKASACVYGLRRDKSPRRARGQGFEGSSDGINSIFMLDTGYWILDTGYWILDTGYRLIIDGIAGWVERSETQHKQMASES